MFLCEASNMLKRLCNFVELSLILTSVAKNIALLSTGLISFKSLVLKAPKRYPVSSILPSFPVKGGKAVQTNYKVILPNGNKRKKSSFTKIE